MLPGFRHLGEASPNTFHHGRWGALYQTPSLYSLSHQLSIYGRQTPLPYLWKRWTSKVLTSIQERHRLFANKAFHRLHNKLAHCTRFAIRRKIHNAYQQRNYKDTKRDDSWKSGQTIFGRLWQNEFQALKPKYASAYPCCLSRLCLKVTSRLRLRYFCRIAGIWRLIRRRRKTWRRGKRHDGLDERYTESPSTWKVLPQKGLQGKGSSYSSYKVLKHVNSS